MFVIRCAPACEVAVLVEDAVVGQETLAIDRLHLAIGADGTGVVEIAVEVGRADERDDAAGRAGDLRERTLGRAQEAWPEQEVLRRIPSDGELGHEHEVGVGVAGLVDRVEDPLPIAFEVADDGVDLGERESHRSSLRL
jgi:hypothetical protein